MAVINFLLLCSLASLAVGTTHNSPPAADSSGSAGLDASRRDPTLFSGIDIPDSRGSGIPFAGLTTGNSFGRGFDSLNANSGRFVGTTGGFDSRIINSGAGNSNFNTNVNAFKPDNTNRNFPIYEGHVIAEREGGLPLTTTITNKVTKTHTLRIPSTSDVWVTSVKMVTVPVTRLVTERQYVPEYADTVTSYIRITKTDIEVATRTAEILPTKTMVSVFTKFVTQTNTVELWHPIVHQATHYEVMTLPVLETQTLVQVLYTTASVTRTVNVTSVRHRDVLFPRGRSGRVTVGHSNNY